MSNVQSRMNVSLFVTNGEDFIEEVLDSILDQPLKNFKLIIVDNASTDETEKICREYAAKDQRICYYRSNGNQSPETVTSKAVDKEPIENEYIWQQDPEEWLLEKLAEPSEE